MVPVRISVRGLSKRFALGGAPSAPKPHMTELMRRGLERLVGQHRSGTEGAARQEFWALKDVNFELAQGERLGIIGRNGAGKSTLLKIIARLLYPTTGEVRIRGRVTALLETGTGFNSDLTGRENVYLSASVYGLSRKEIADRFDEIVDFSGIGDFIEEPVKHYSSGMRSRLGFAVAAHLDPDILILDEVLSVGDIAFARKCLQKIEGLTSGGRTLIFVSHGMSNIARFCDRALWLEKGRILMDGTVKDVAEAYSSSMLKLTAEASSESAKRTTSGQGINGDRPAAAATQDPERPAAEILAFRLLDAKDETPKTVFVRQESVHVHVRFRALRADLPVIAVVHVLKDGLHVFSTHPMSTIMPQTGEVYDAVVEIPAQTLNKGIYHFSAGVQTPTSPVMRHSELEMALSCVVHDRMGDEDVFGGDYRGVMRPQLSWRVSPHSSRGREVSEPAPIEAHEPRPA
jgi:lipopolysaccharide transport system ATP-binding protein